MKKYIVNYTSNNGEKNQCVIKADNMDAVIEIWALTHCGVITSIKPIQ